MSSLCISSNISFFLTYENEKENLCDFLHTSSMVSMRGWFLYLTVTFKIGSFLCCLQLDQRSSAYSGILQLVTTLEKKVFKTLVVSCSIVTTSPLLIKVILSVGKILSERNGFIVFGKVLLSVTFFISKLLVIIFIHLSYK